MTDSMDIIIGLVVLCVFVSGTVAIVGGMVLLHDLWKNRPGDEL